MKSGFVVDLKDGMVVTSLFLVREKEVRSSPRTGKSWLQLGLVDRTGNVSAKMWDNFAGIISTFACDDVIRVRGRAKLYNDQIEITLEQILPVTEKEYDLQDFLPHTRENIDVLLAKLHEHIAAVRDPWLQRLLTSIVDDPAIQPKLRLAPAAMTMHHAYLGGLLEHVVSVCGLARGVAGHYADVELDYLITGAVLHDIGKIDELCYDRCIGYTTAGRLLGHISLGFAMVRKKIEAIAGFPPGLATLVEHLLLSHHGTHEFGSPALPQFREAVVLNFIDDLDSKVGAMRATLDAAAINRDGEWTERNPSLRRSLLRTDEFLHPTEKTNATAGAGGGAGAGAGAQNTSSAAHSAGAQPPAQRSLLDPGAAAKS
jgi:3'-5' exoribonuclease